MGRSARFYAAVSTFAALMLASPWAAAQNDCSISSSPAAGAGHSVPSGTPVTLTATCAHNPTTYQWSTGATTQSIVVMPSGTGAQYGLTAINSAGTLTISYVVNVSGGPSAPGGNGSGGTQVTGSHMSSDTQTTFVCFGLPTCTGIFYETDRFSGCSNSFSFSDTLSITGLNLTAPGALSGDFTVNGGLDAVAQPNGTCIYSRRSAVNTFHYTGTWNGSTGTIVVSVTDSMGQSFSFTFTFRADIPTAAPVFAMDVTTNITPTVASASATFEPRAQDVGTNQKVFVFALAPASSLPHAIVAKDTHFGLAASTMPRDDPIPCVLAQLDSNGQLTGVTASSMQSYTSGVLGAQWQAVTIMNNVATSSVAGATFFVGYGADAATMIASGVNRSAVTVPGAVTCNPQPPQTGWWWNPVEGGRGFSIEAQGSNLFFAAFHYDATGRAAWNVSPGPVSLGGSYFTSDLYNVTGGQTLGGPYHAANAVKAGTITLSFRDASHGTMTWPGGSVPIERQPLVPGGLEAPAQANAPETGWWWNPNESGRGFFIEWQKGYADLAGYMYDDNGNPVWYISVFETPNPRTFSGAWWSFANGQSMSGAYHAPTQTSSNVAPVTIQFSAPDTAVMTLPNGRTTNLVRQRF